MFVCIYVAIYFRAWYDGCGHENVRIFPGSAPVGNTGKFPGVLVGQSITGTIGIRETSTHVASIESYIEAAAQIHSSNTLTA